MNVLTGHELKIQVLKDWTSQLYGKKEIKVVEKNKTKNVIVRDSSKRTFISNRLDKD